MNKISIAFAISMYSLSLCSMEQPSKVPDSRNLMKLDLSNYLLLPNGRHMQFLYDPASEKFHVATFDENMKYREGFSYVAISEDLSRIRPIGFALLARNNVLLASFAQLESENDSIILCRVSLKNAKETCAESISCNPGSFYKINFFFDKPNDAVIVKALQGDEDGLDEVQFTVIPGQKMKKEVIKRYSLQEIRQNP